MLDTSSDEQQGLSPPDVTVHGLLPLRHSRRRGTPIQMIFGRITTCIRGSASFLGTGLGVSATASRDYIESAIVTRNGSLSQLNNKLGISPLDLTANDADLAYELMDGDISDSMIYKEIAAEFPGLAL
jgi:hypothetical protein